MVKHTQTIRRLLPISYLNVFDEFVELALRRLGPYQTSAMELFVKIVNDFYHRWFKVS